MTIVQQGSINTAALVVPDLYVQIVPPQNLVLNGVPTNVIGMVGTAPWGPVGQAAIVGTMQDFVRQFSGYVARLYDMGTMVACAIQQGASAFKCVRVTDGTDTAASSAVQTTGMTLTSLYTGSGANADTWTLSPGTKATTYKLVLARAGLVPEVYDNLGAGLTGNAAWVAIAAAVNTGAGVLRGPSQLMAASAGASTTTPVTTGTPASGTLSGGTDGSTTITTTALIGVDTVPRKGMYALRGQGCSIGVLADSFDSTQWTTQAAFGLSEGIYMITCGPSGDTIANAVTTKATAGLDSYAVKLMFGDWIYWNDPVNAILRVVSPLGFVAGVLGNLSPQNSSLNKQLFSVVGSQKSGVPGSGQTNVYSAIELQTLFQVGIDVIANPQPGGSYWGVRLGHNSSSNAAINGDNYTRMTNFIAATLNAGMGLYVGLTVNATLFKRIKATLTSFFQNLLGQGLLGTLDGSLPFGVVCDTSNNPLSRTSLGYVQADCQVQYQAINEKFIVNLEGGQTVVINKTTTPVNAVS